MRREVDLISCILQHMSVYGEYDDLKITIEGVKMDTTLCGITNIVEKEGIYSNTKWIKYPPHNPKLACKKCLEKLK